MNIYLDLFLTFAKMGVMTFGGGYAMLPILQREIVQTKKWASDEEIMDYFAIGQCTPGIIAVNTATFIGQKTAGNLGGIVATLGIVFPCFVIISLLAGVIETFHSLTDKKYIDFNNLPSRKVLFCPFEYLYNIFLLCYVVLLTFLFTF